MAGTQGRHHRSLDQLTLVVRSSEGILRRVLQPSTREGEWVLDFFAGSGTTGAVAGAMGRRFVLVDSNADAIDVMRHRLSPYDVAFSELP